MRSFGVTSNCPRKPMLSMSLTSSCVATLYSTPSRCVLVNDSRPATFSPSGPENEPFACTKLSSPYPISKSYSGVKLGLRVVTRIAPAVVFLPNNVPCGPRNTSTRSTSMKSSVVAAGRAYSTPST